MLLLSLEQAVVDARIVAARHGKRPNATLTSADKELKSPRRASMDNLLAQVERRAERLLPSKRQRSKWGLPWPSRVPNADIVVQNMHMALDEAKREWDARWAPLVQKVMTDSDRKDVVQDRLGAAVALIDVIATLAGKSRHGVALFVKRALPGAEGGAPSWTPVGLPHQYSATLPNDKGNKARTLGARVGAIELLQQLSALALSGPSSGGPVPMLHVHLVVLPELLVGSVPTTTSVINQTDVLVRPAAGPARQNGKVGLVEYAVEKRIESALAKMHAKLLGSAEEQIRTGFYIKFTVSVPKTSLIFEK
jgi:hypothetical protein